MTKKEAAKEALSKFEPLFDDHDAFVTAIAEISTLPQGRGKTLSIAGGGSLRAVFVDPTFTCKITDKKADTEAPSFEALTVQERADSLLKYFSSKNLKICGERYFFMSSTSGVLSELKKGYTSLEHEAMVKFKGKQVPREAKETLQLSMAVMSVEKPEQFLIEPRNVPVITFDGDAVTPCWNRLNFNRTGSDVIPPRLKEFTDRIQDDLEREAFFQFWGSVLDPDADRSQYMYMYTEGGDGKSAFINMLHKTLGSAVYVTRGESYMRQFGRAPIEGKRVVVLQEESSVGFLSSAAFKELTGDDVIEVEKKGIDPYLINVSCKIVVVSNNPATLVGGRADERRILPITVSPLPESRIDLRFKAELAAEGPAILAYCWSRYLEWKAKHPDGALMGNPESTERIKAASMRQEIADYFEATFDQGGPEDYVPARAVNTLLKDFANGNGFVERQAKQEFKRKYGLATTRRLSSGSKNGYFGCTLVKN